MVSRHSLRESPDEVDGTGKYHEAISWDTVPTLTFMISRDGTAVACRRVPENTEAGGASDGHAGLDQAIIPTRYKADAETIADYEKRNNVYVYPAEFAAAKKLRINSCYNGRIFVDEGIISFWDPLTTIFPVIDSALAQILKRAHISPRALLIEYWVTDRAIDKDLHQKWDDGRHEAKSLLIPYSALNTFLADVRAGVQQQHGIPQNQRHIAASYGVSNPVVPGFGSYRGQELAARAGYDTAAEFHAAHPFESLAASHIVRQIMGEAIPGSEDQDVTADEFLSHGPRTIDHGHGITQNFSRDGDEFWYKDNVRHRDGDKPAVIMISPTDGVRYSYWYRNGKVHRDGDKPAITASNGTMEWYRDGKIHRDGDLPAIVQADGSEFWYKSDRLHRDNDLPAIIRSDGTQEWFRNGLRHRDGGKPAIIRKRSQEHWRNGKRTKMVTS